MRKGSRIVSEGSAKGEKGGVRKDHVLVGRKRRVSKGRKRSRGMFPSGRSERAMLEGRQPRQVCVSINACGVEKRSERHVPKISSNAIALKE